MMKNKKGITLIALIITIIVLLILAGISISLVIGDNGVLTRAQSSKNKTDLAQIQEEIQLAWSSVEADGIPNKWSNEQKRAALQEELRKQDSSATATLEEDVITVNYKGQTTTISLTSGTVQTGEGESVESVIVTIEGEPVTLTKDNFGDYLGKKVLNYTGAPSSISLSATDIYGTLNEETYNVSTTYRLYWVDFENKYKDGVGTIYLKADSENINTYMLNWVLIENANSSTSKMKELNPELYDENGNIKGSDGGDIQAATWFLDTSEWDSLRTGVASPIANKIKYIVGAPPCEMMIDGYNLHYQLEGTEPNMNWNYDEENPSRTKLFYRSGRNDFYTSWTPLTQGYEIAPSFYYGMVDGEWYNHGYAWAGSYYNIIVPDSEVGTCWANENNSYWLASPCAYERHYGIMYCNTQISNNVYGDYASFCPVVALQPDATLVLED